MSRKFTYEEVKDFIEVESQSGCVLLSSEYLGVNYPLELKCKCGTKFSTTFGYFKRSKKPKTHCDDCGLQIRINKRTFTYEDVKAYIEVESKSKCKLISKEYIKSDKKLEILCRCGAVFETTFARFSSKTKPRDCCNGCAKKQRTESRIAEAIEYVEITSKSSCVVIDTNLDDKAIELKLKCKCGNIFKTNFNRFKNQGQRTCRECRREVERREYLENFKNKVFELEKGEYVVVGDFKDSATKIQILHKKCENTYLVVPNNFINGNRCPYCNKTRPKTNESFRKEIYDMVGDEYTVLGEYTTINNKIKMRHNLCENVFDIIASSFLHNGTRCPQCSESKGEQVIRQYLDINNIKFIKEYSFDNLFGVNGGLLRFDFAMFQDSNIICLIEYDGEFHFKKQYYHDGYEELQIHDKRKNQYCKGNNIPLIRIPYWQFDKIEQILDKWLNKYGSIHNEDIKEIT